MVADFMRNHVGLREVARSTKLARQRFIKTQVDVDLLVARAVKRPHCRLALTASGLRGAAKQHQPWS